MANCHVVMPAPNATFGLTEIRLGLWPFLVYSRGDRGRWGAPRRWNWRSPGRIFDAPGGRANWAWCTKSPPIPRGAPLEVAAAMAEFQPHRDSGRA